MGLELDKAQRAKDEGRGGGLYDRQDVEKKRWDSDDEEFDDFGRRKKKTKPGQADAKAGDKAASSGNKASSQMSKQQAALERLRNKHARAAGSAKKEDEKSSRRSRSRSRRRERSRSRRR